MSEFQQCQGVKNDGTPCKSMMGLSSGGLCMNHDPARREAMRAIRVEGGRASGAKKRAARADREAKPQGAAVAPPPLPKTSDDAVRYFAWAVDEMANGRMDADQGRTIGYLLTGFRSTVEKRDIEQRLKLALRTIAELQKQPRRVS